MLLVVPDENARNSVDLLFESCGVRIFLFFGQFNIDFSAWIRIYSKSQSRQFSPFIINYNKQMMIKKPKRTSQTLTGQIQPITFKDIETRVNAIRYRAKTPSHTQTIDRFTNTRTSLGRAEFYIPIVHDMETDQMLTNFNQKRVALPVQNQQKKVTPTRSRILSMQKSFQIKRESVYEKSEGKEFKRTNKQTKVKQTQKSKIQSYNKQEIYHKEISELHFLYQALSSILACIKEDLVQVQQSIHQYLQYIQTKKLSFIDDFMAGRQKKLQRMIRQARLQQSLSIAYLFLQMAQKRIQNHQSYLTNFLGYCLSNVLLTARIYILKEKRRQYLTSNFQDAIKCVQIGSFGQELTSVKDVLLRLQHNNEIVTMMQRKLGRFNPKFQACIQRFFKQAQRKNQSCVQCTHYIFQYLALHIHQSQLTGISTSLQIAPVPYCPPPSKSYTLVIQPLGILLSEGQTRPYIFQFLQWAVKHFQVIFWTWEMPYQPQIQSFMQKLEYYLTAKLYRYHCQEVNGIWVKDLTRLGRQLQKTLIIDYDKRIYEKQLNNGIQMRWRPNGASRDKGLLFLCQILQEMISTESIVSDTLKIYAEELYNIGGA